MDKTVIVINGRPRSGKDSCVQFMAEALESSGTFTSAFSSIDPVRNLLMSAGFDLSAKTEADRALLSEVGDAVEKHSGFRTTQCIDHVKSVFEFAETRKKSGACVFLHIREPEMISKIRARLLTEKIDFVTVLVQSKRSENHHANNADSRVELMRYDTMITNDGDLGDLRMSCRTVLSQLFRLPF